MIGLFSLAGVQAATGQNFYDYLEQGYREVATYAVNRAGDADLGKHFTGKAQLAAADHTVIPDMPTTMALPKNVRDEMMTARKRLDSALAAGAQEIDPLNTAVAQVNLDCWLAQFKGAAQDGSAACRQLFYLAIAKLPMLPDETLPPLPSDIASTEGAQLAATGSAPVSAVGDPATGTAPGMVGGVIAAVGGPLERLGATADSTLASVNDSVDGSLAGSSAPGSDTARSTVGTASDTVGGVVGSTSDTVGGVLGATGSAVGGALGAVGDAVGNATGGSGSTSGSGGSTSGGGGSTSGGGGGLGGGGLGGGGLGGGGLGGGGLGGGGLGGGGLGLGWRRWFGRYPVIPTNTKAARPTDLREMHDTGPRRKSGLRHPRRTG